MARVWKPLLPCFDTSSCLGPQDNSVSLRPFHARNLSGLCLQFGIIENQGVDSGIDDHDNQGWPETNSLLLDQVAD